MLEFKIIETLKSNNELLKVIKDYTYKIKKGTIKHLLHTNLQAIEPIGAQVVKEIFKLCKEGNSASMVAFFYFIRIINIII